MPLVIALLKGGKRRREGVNALAGDLLDKTKGLVKDGVSQSR